MSTNELRQALRAEPFRKFSLLLTSGRRVKVEHPEFVALSAGGRTLAVYSHESDAFIVLDLLLVEAIQFGGGRSGKKSA